MSPTPENITDVARAIQLALAPAFLLTGIAALLTVMTGRLARIVDRGRALTEGESIVGTSAQQLYIVELQALEQRRHLTSVAITACTVAALLICVVIAALFIDVLLHVPLKWFVGALFTVSMLVLVIGLVFFLREVHLATQTVRFPLPRASSGRPPPI